MVIFLKSGLVITNIKWYFKRFPKKTSWKKQFLIWNNNEQRILEVAWLVRFVVWGSEIALSVLATLKYISEVGARWKQFDFSCAIKYKCPHLFYHQLASTFTLAPDGLIDFVNPSKIPWAHCEKFRQSTQRRPFCYFFKNTTVFE